MTTPESNVCYRVCNCNGYTKYDSLEELKDYLKKDVENGFLFHKIKRIVKVETSDIEMPDFVRDYNSLVESKGQG